MVIRTIENRRWEHMEKDCIKLDALIKHFELYNKTDGKSPKTIDWYSMVLRQIAQKSRIHSSTSFTIIHSHSFE